MSDEDLKDHLNIAKRCSSVLAKALDVEVRHNVIGTLEDDKSCKGAAHIGSQKMAGDDVEENATAQISEKNDEPLGDLDGCSDLSSVIEMSDNDLVNTIYSLEEELVSTPAPSSAYPLPVPLNDQLPGDASGLLAATATGPFQNAFKHSPSKQEQVYMAERNSEQVVKAVPNAQSWLPPLVDGSLMPSPVLTTERLLRFHLPPEPNASTTGDPSLNSFHSSLQGMPMEATRQNGGRDKWKPGNNQVTSFCMYLFYLCKIRSVNLKLKTLEEFIIKIMTMIIFRSQIHDQASYKLFLLAK